MPLEVAIVGAGLVGPLLALLLVQRFFTVKIYESRRDPRQPDNLEGRSFDLALSKRGLDALEKVGLLKTILDGNCVPVDSRLVYTRDGRTFEWKYGRKGDCLYSIERRRLNRLLVDEAERRGVQIFFQHKVTKCDIKEGTLTVINTGVTPHEKHKVSADLIIGCDGAHSLIREHGFMHGHDTHFRFEQSYIPYGYKEFHVPATVADDFALKERHLHLWPRHDFMLMGLPNPDKTITLTLFMPFEKFEEVGKDQQRIVALFREEFPGITAKLGGEHTLIEQYLSTEPGSMISIKCTPYHSGKALLLGDAAHAMVPFYGQGVNAGFEDCRIFDDMLAQTYNNLVAAAKQFSSTRKKDADAIVALSLYNFDEMRDFVSRRSFKISKHFMAFVNRCTGGCIVPLYSMVAFNDIPYSEVVTQHVRQQEWFTKLGRLILVMIIAIVLCVAIPLPPVLSAVLTALFLIALYIIFIPQFHWKYNQP